MNIVFNIKVKIHMLIKWSYRSPSIMLTIEPRMNSIVWAHSPIFFQHMSFWCPFLDSHQTIYQSIIGVHLRSDTELGTSTLNKIDNGIWQVCNDFGCDAEWQQLPMDATQQMSHYRQAYSQSETCGDTSPFVVHVEEFVMVSTQEILQLRQEFVPYCDSSLVVLHTISIISFNL